MWYKDSASLKRRLYWMERLAPREAVLRQSPHGRLWWRALEGALLGGKARGKRRCTKRLNTRQCGNWRVRGTTRCHRHQKRLTRKQQQAQALLMQRYRMLLAQWRQQCDEL